MDVGRGLGILDKKINATKDDEGYEVVEGYDRPRPEVIQYIEVEVEILVCWT